MLFGQVDMKTNSCLSFFIEFVTLFFRSGCLVERSSQLKVFTCLKLKKEQQGMLHTE